MVEWKKIWEVTTWDKKFSGVDKHMQPKVIKYYYYLANELADLERHNGDIRILYTTNKEAFAISNEVEGTISEGEVVTIPWGGNVNIQYFKGRFVTADNRIATSNNTNYLNNKFLYYWMLSQKVEIEKMYRGAGIKHPSMLSVLSMQIPIPSLSEQTRIVGILDTFTSAIDNLKEQIAQRRKQYEYYRDQLLDLEGKEGVEMKTLGEIADFRNGKGHEKIIDSEGKYIVVNSKFISSNGFVKKFCNQQLSPLYVDDILMVMSDVPNGKAIAKCYLVEKNNLYTLNQRIGAFHVFDRNVSTKFLYKIINRNKQLLQYDNKIDQTNLRKDDILSIIIPIPSLSEQSRIVSILDTFEASIQNLEAQLKEREKQYEYYRNKLLTFE